MSAPDWEGFGRDILQEWPVRDIDGAELFEAALRNKLIREIPGGYNPENHIDAEGICPERGDPWYEYAFGPSRADLATSAPKVKALVEALQDALDAWDTHRESGDMMEGYWVSDARAALAALEGGDA